MPDDERNGDGLVRIAVAYRVKVTNDRRNLVYPFYIIPGEGTADEEGRTVSLPVPNLDDRKFQDIVDDAKRLIPKLLPEWTNHNVSDPGVALIELFAWMSEMIIFRLNQTPDKLYTQFLNLLGVRPFAAQPATADLTFWLSAPTDQTVTVPTGTVVSGVDPTRPGAPGRRVRHDRGPAHRAADADGGADRSRRDRPDRRVRRPALRP